MTDESVFVVALAIPAPAERAAYLDRACAGNPALHAEVEALLAAHAASNPLDDTPRHPSLTGAHESRPDPGAPRASPGDWVGPYKLLERIGEGGMGEVWVADQEEPIRRRVAVKLIKPGMDSRGVLARFEAERQALALMDHPNIAKVLDAGTTPDGRPYFVMELVKGTPITDSCDARRLTPRERLELFVTVCQAIQHAHQKGVIHRDIKPSNVLVELHDDKPVAKVIDFGVAKAVGQQLTEKTIDTGLGAIVGTPAYMAPEQASFNALDIDTRADVYALGVLLYELLAGSPPIEPARLRRAALEEVLRLVREQEPPRPSARLCTSETKASIAAVRRSEPGKLSALLKGELEWIVMKALEKDRARRYDTPGGLAKDVQRYLSGDAVEACPPTMGYRLRKAYRKNRGVVWVGFLIAAVLVTAAGVSSWQAIRAERAREREEVQRRWAEASAEVAREVQRFFCVEVFKQTRVKFGATGPADLTVRQALDRAAGRLDGRFADKPLVEAGIRHSIGASYQSLGEYARVLPQLERARDLCRRATEQFPDENLLLNYHRVSVAIGEVCAKTGAEERAIQTLREETEWFERTRGEADPEALAVAHTFARALIESRDLGRCSEGWTFLQNLLERARLRGVPEQELLNLKRDLGSTLMFHGGGFDAGEKLLREVLSSFVATFGDDSFDAAAVRKALALNLCLRPVPNKSRNAEALVLLERSAAVYRKVLTDDHPSTLDVLSWLATLNEQFDRPAEAAEVWLVITRSAAFRPNRSSWFQVRVAAAALLARGEPARAEQLIRQHQNQLTAPGDDWWPHEATSLLGEALFAQHKSEGERSIATGYEELSKREAKIDADARDQVLANAIDRASRVAESNSRPDEVKKWQAEKEKLLRFGPPSPPMPRTKWGPFSRSD